ncbi:MULTISPECIES: GNAT family N-acetyltransferase [unclassified Knoellia]|uniref:GNAT family N-acetyltransferase n=1 Tax=Knoellia altitudinis TaxID=3404795 RepID=UPI003614EF09
MRDDMIIRRERVEDHAGIAALHDDAFPRVEGAARSVESALVDELRGDGDVIEELTFVAELDGEVVGHVMCSAATLGEGTSVGLGPIAVAPALQRQGIGAALMASVIASAEQRGDAAIVLLGDPGYYAHFGFVAASRHGVDSPRPWEDAHFQIKTLRAWRAEQGGPFRFAPAFERLDA